MTRSGLRVCDLFDEEVFEAKFRRMVHGFQKRFGDLLKYDIEEEITKYKVGCYYTLVQNMY
jgi:adenylosuccinate synthase